MSFGSDDKPATYQTSTVSNDPWAPQQGYLTRGFSEARGRILDNPRQYYPNSTVVPFSGQTESALQMQENRARSGSPVTRSAQNLTSETLGGKYLTSDTNPYMQQAMASAIRPMATQFSETVLPGIASQFSGSGRYGSGAQERAVTRAADDFTRQVGDVTGAMAYRGYGDERQRQMQAATLAPTMAAQDYVDIQALKGVGQEREAQAGAQLQEQIDRFNFNQNAPREDVANYMALIGGGYGSTGTQSTPIYRNKTADALSMASTAAGIGGSLFGQGGIWPQ